jgi:hypothetical protein
MNDDGQAAFAAEVRRYLDDPHFARRLRQLGPGEPADTLRTILLVRIGVYDAGGLEPPALTPERVHAAVAGMNAKLRAAGLPEIGAEADDP